MTRLPGLAAALVQSKPDLILAGGPQATSAARGATATIPIVMTTIGDPVVEGVVASLARPGGNITGPSLNNPEITSKRLELLLAIAPAVTRVAFLFNPANRIFKGAKPADLPIEQPTRFELIINGKTAKALGLKIPYALLITAEQVIE